MCIVHSLGLKMFNWSCIMYVCVHCAQTLMLVVVGKVWLVDSYAGCDKCYSRVGKGFQLLPLEDDS
jgi:hypothetical protein